MFSARSPKSTKSGAYAENLYKRSSFYRDWSHSLKIVSEDQKPSFRDSLNRKEDEVYNYNHVTSD